MVFDQHGRQVTQVAIPVRETRRGIPGTQTTSKIVLVTRQDVKIQRDVALGFERCIDAGLYDRSSQAPMCGDHAGLPPRPWYAYVMSYW
jgi:hypothetical protein